MKRPYRFLVAGSLLAAAAFLASVDAFARRSGPPSSDGTVLSVAHGGLSILRGSAWVTLARGGSVAAGARLRTDDRAIAVLDLPGRGRTVLGPGSELEIPAPGADARFELTRGAVWMNATLRPGATLRVRTPQVVAGVRGTSFSVLADDEGAAVCTCRGTVDVELRDSRVVRTGTGRFVPVDSAGHGPARARDDRDLLCSPRGDRYDWCFTCHEIGRRGELRRGWSAEALGV